MSAPKQLHYAAETNRIAVEFNTSIKNACYNIASKKKLESKST